MFRSLLYCLGITMISCSFPGRKLTTRVEKIRENSAELKIMIMRELPMSELNVSMSRIYDKNLKAFLRELKVSEISITYKANNKTEDTLSAQLPYLNNTLDSTITFT